MSLSERNNVDFAVHDQEELKEPKRYTCILHNDHFTTRDFVVYVLVKVFHLDEATAQVKMLEVHQKGQGRVGDFSFDVAQTKAMLVQKLARENEFPLKCTVEPL